MRTLNITDFTKYPGPRYITLGEHSGEKFREDFLIEALKSDSEIQINLDGVIGYGSSFLEEIFGGLIRAMPAHPAQEYPNGSKIIKHDFITMEMIDFIKSNLISNDDPSVIAEINSYLDLQLTEIKDKK